MGRQARPAGRWEPAELGVHPVAGGDPRGSMPTYIRRPHDEKLRRVLDPEVADSRLIVVRGDAGTGKSRAAYEAVAARLADWPLEYPPTAAALAARLEAGIPAGTVLWLGELRRYADAEGGAAALNRLDDLLDGEGHLVITTIWPEHWDAYVTAAGARRGAGDPARAAGRLVAHLDELAFFREPNPAYGGIIDVPARFTAEQLSATARALATWAAQHADLEGSQRLARLLKALRIIGADGALQTLLARDPVGHGTFEDPWEAAALLAELRAAQASGAVQALLARDLASHSHIDYADSVAWLLEELRAAQASEAIRTLLARDPASRVHFFDLQAVSRLAAELHAAGDSEAVRTLATRAVNANADDPGYFAEHLEVFRTAGAGEGVRIVLARDPAGRARLEDPGKVAWLLEELRAAGADDAIQALLARDPAGQARLDDPHDVARLLAALRAAGAGQALTSLATRAAAGASLEDPRGVAQLLRELQAAVAGAALQALLARDPAGQVSVGSDRPRGVARLLAALRAAGAGEAAAALAVRAADAGMFDLAEDRASYRFGREPDGAAARPWRWA